MARVTNPRVQEVVETFELLDEWTERYRYLIELGGELAPLPDEERVDTNKVKGCMSQVWLVGYAEGGIMHFRADSDAHIVRGLVALVLRIFDQTSATSVLETDHAKVLDELGLGKHLSPGRNNGLHSMIARIKKLAAAAIESEPTETIDA